MTNLETMGELTEAVANFEEKIARGLSAGPQARVNAVVAQYSNGYGARQRRMAWGQATPRQGQGCFLCGVEGHWRRECPNNRDRTGDYKDEQRGGNYKRERQRQDGGVGGYSGRGRPTQRDSGGPWRPQQEGEEDRKSDGERSKKQEERKRPREDATTNRGRSKDANGSWLKM